MMPMWLRHVGGVAAATMLVLLLSPPTTDAALNAEAQSPEDMTAELRRSIFVETAYLRERQGESCSSLDGPQCLAARLGGEGSDAGIVGVDAAAVPLDGAHIGVLPETLLHGFGANEPAALYAAEGDDTEFVTPEYNFFEQFRREHEQSAGQLGVSTLAGSEAEAVLHDESVETGVLHFAGLAPDQRVPLAFSAGCQVALSRRGTAAGSRGRAMTTGRRSSWGRCRCSSWRAASSSAPSAVVGGRLGLNTAWTSHLDPVKLKRARGWVDVGGSPYTPVDELAFIASSGLEVGAIEVAAPSGGLDDERLVLLLMPEPDLESSAAGDTKHEPPKFKPGLLTGRTPPSSGDLANPAWLVATAEHDELFDLNSVGKLLAAATLSQGMLKGGSDVAGALLKDGLASLPFEAAARALVIDLSRRERLMPKDILRTLKREEDDIVQALLAWTDTGENSEGLQVWRRNAPTTFPWGASESVMARYTMAKRWQTKLDLLTVALMHVQHFVRSRNELL
eukprot:CAMPEP_0117601128 /NCGR_PEP_ID=MMETSP0784-20121206/76863_1 /TAXON_ID=39447 /ORGANISM="" /LENGTH=507 /DNA_ID=CAMNT_0005403821 /DNA_START=65 /DNA_END=1588 /DNA_ORIENTATION=+